MECDDGSGISSRVYNGREDGVMGSLEAGGVAEGDRPSVWQAVVVDLFQLEAGGVAEGDRPSVWQAVVVDLFPGGTARGYSSCAAAPLEAGIDAVGARGDFQGYYSTSIGTIDR